MSDALTTTYKRLLLQTKLDTFRYIYDSFKIKNRLTGLIGARGTGKTTLLLQFIKQKMKDFDRCIYASLDNMYFTGTSLISFVKDMHEVRGVTHFFFDEVHKYPLWNQELKNLYDSFPELFFVYSGSSSIDLVKGSYDLSRRSVLFKLKGLSFREYLNFIGVASIAPVSFEDILFKTSEVEQRIGAIPKIRGHFKDYLNHGYYPFFNEDLDTYSQKLLRIIDKTVFEDIAQFYALRTEHLVYFKRMLAYIGTIPPGELNINSISKHIGLDNKTVKTYVSIMESTGLITLVGRDRAQSALLKATEKIYLDNPNLYSVIASETGFASNVGSIREVFFITMLKNSGKNVFYSSVGDFSCDGYFFEIGGKNKTRTQIKDVPETGFLVKDDIVFGSRNEIPLYLFGFLY